MSCRPDYMDPYNPGKDCSGQLRRSRLGIGRRFNSQQAESVSLNSGRPEFNSVRTELLEKLLKRLAPGRVGR